MKKIKDWFVNKLLPFLKKVAVIVKGVLKFLKKWGVHLVNYLVLWLLYGRLWTVENVQFGLVAIGGLWLFCLTAYYLFWKICKVEDWFKKNDDLPDFLL